MPDIGLAIELWDGVIISWDGRVVRHCTAVQECDNRHRLYSLFYTIPNLVDKKSKEAEQMRDALTVKHELVRGCRPKCLQAGDVIWVRWSPSKSKVGAWTRRRARVVEVHNDGIDIMWCTDHGMQSSFIVTIASCIVDDIVTHAGAVHPEMYLQEVSLSMLGKTLLVYVYELDDVCEGMCSTIQLDGSGEDSWIEVACAETVIHVPVHGFMNPPMCTI